MATIQQNDNILCLKREHMAILLMISGPILFSLGFIYSNQHKFHPNTTAFFRGIALIAITYPLARAKEIDLTFPSPNNFKWQIVRNSIMVFQGLAFAWCQFYLPLPIAITLNSTSPIFSALWDRILNGIKLNRAQTMWFVVAFLGVILTANGNYLSFIFTGESQETSSSFQNYISSDPKMMLLAGLVQIFSMFMHGFGVVITKRMKDTNSIHVNYFQGLLIFFVAVLFLPYGYSDLQYHKPTLEESIKCLIFGGIPLTMGQLAYIGSLLLCHNYAMLTPFMFSSIIFGYLLSIFRYGQSVNVICLVGAVAIVLGIVFIVRKRDKN